MHAWIVLMISKQILSLIIPKNGKKESKKKQKRFLTQSIGKNKEKKGKRLPTL